MDQVLKNLKLDEIKPNKSNFRNDFEGPAFDGMVASVLKKGVLQPILVRPVGGTSKKVKYEIVFGERRFRAAKAASKKMGGKKTIPAIIRKLSDGEAFDLMVVENLEREDLSEFEEANGFKAYLDKNGQGSLSELADRTGINPSYIRRRVSVLELPQAVLDAWGRGEIAYGYLEQLTRLDDEQEILGYLDEVLNGYSIDSIQDLKRQIDNQAVKLEHALFDLKQSGCAACALNSDVQFKLFEIDAEASKCMKPSCFMDRQTAWLTENWQATQYRKKFKTTGFRYVDDVDRQQCGFFHYKGQADKECYQCDGFVTLFSGARLQVFSERACVGETSCYKRHVKKANQKNAAKTGAGDSEGQGGQPRVKWHGEHFREIFYQDTIPERFKRLSARGLTSVQLSLFALLKSSFGLKQWFVKQYGGADEDDHYFPGDDHIFSTISKMDVQKANAALKSATLEVIMYDDFLADARRIVADHIGIDLSKEWVLTEAYLRKKTISEMVGMGERFGIFADPKAKDYLTNEIKKTDFRKCKKRELINLFIKSGVDLSGKVPDEILAK
jgi:ParB/RepB/Spo0J family partition protein